MALKRFTFILGLVFLAVGLLGFVPAFLVAPFEQPALGVDAFHGLLFGIFPVNAIHNLVHIAFGVAALVMSQDIARSRLFNRATAWIYGVLAVIGLLPGLNTLFGLMPLHGNDIWLHGVIALAAAYFGYVWHESTDEARRPGYTSRTTAGRMGV